MGCEAAVGYVSNQDWISVTDPTKSAILRPKLQIRDRAMSMAKKDFDEGLQRAYAMGRALAFFKHGRRRIQLFNALTDRAFAGRERPGVLTGHRSIPARTGSHDIPLVIYRPHTAADFLPVMLYMHGGGYVSGSPEMAPGLEDYIALRPCIIVAPRYRRALTAPYPAALDDCYDALLWIRDNASQIGGRADGIIVAGNSAGGGLAAAVTLRNRDSGDVSVAFQMPLYPMLDHRCETESARTFRTSPIWDTKANRVCWSLYLRSLARDGQGIPAWASPALNADHSGFPPTITFVGGLDPFRDEVAAYAAALKDANVPVEFRIFPKAFHGFEEVVPDAGISLEAKAFVMDAFAKYFDRHLPES